jgi:hypothetical protein
VTARLEPVMDAPEPRAATQVRRLRSGDLAIPLACLVMIAAALWGSAHKSTWIDETYSMDTASRSLSGTWHQALHFELQPPLYFLLLHFWLLIHQGVAWARLLSTVFATGTVAVMGGIGDLLFPRRGRWLALVAACSPMIAWSAAETRGYALVILLNAISLYFFLRLTVAESAHPRRDAVCYAVSTYLALLTAYYSGFLLPGECLAAILLGRQPRRWVVPALVAVGVALVPWLPTVLMQVTHHPDLNPTLATPSVWNRLENVGLLAMDGGFAQSPFIVRPFTLVVVGVVLLAIPVVRAVAADGTPPVRWTRVETALAVPLGLALGTFLLFRFFDIESVLWRHLSALVPASITLWSVWVVRTRPAVRRGLGAFVIAVMAVGMVSKVRNETVADYRGAAEWISRRGGPSDVVFLAGPEALLPFRYYYGQRSPLFTVPVPMKLEAYAPAGFAIQDSAQLAARWAAAPPSPHAWLVLEDFVADSARTIPLLKRFIAGRYRTVDARRFDQLHVLQLDAR